jgi:hypothetical protein
MARKLTQICIYFRPAAHPMFRNADGSSAARPNKLKITIQPDEGITLRFEGKVPGQGMNVRSAVMDFDYVDQFGGQIPEAYAHLLLDAMQGDRSLFKDRHESVADRDARLRCLGRAAGQEHAHVPIGLVGPARGRCADGRRALAQPGGQGVAVSEGRGFVKADRVGARRAGPGPG